MISLEIKNKEGKKINSDELFENTELLNIIKKRMIDVFKNKKSIHNAIAITDKNRLYNFSIVDDLDQIHIIKNISVCGFGLEKQKEK